MWENGNSLMTSEASFPTVRLGGFRFSAAMPIVSSCTSSFLFSRCLRSWCVRQAAARPPGRAVRSRSPHPSDRSGHWLGVTATASQPTRFCSAAASAGALSRVVGSVEDTRIRRLRRQCDRVRLGVGNQLMQVSAFAVRSVKSRSRPAAAAKLSCPVRPVRSSIGGPHSDTGLRTWGGH